MKTIHLFKYNDVVSLNKPSFYENYKLSSLNDFMMMSFMNIEVLSEFLIDVPDSFSAYQEPLDKLSKLCGSAKETIEHYFYYPSDDYDVI